MACRPTHFLPLLALLSATAQAATALPAARPIVYLTGESTGIVVAQDALEVRKFGSYDLVHRGGLQRKQ